MRRLTLVSAVLAALIIPLGGLMAAAAAMASNVSAVYKDCEAHGQLTGHYSRAELQAALKGMPSEVAEYSDCQVLINQALVRLSSHGGGQHGNSAGGLAGGGGGNGGNGAGGSGGGSAGAGAGTTGASSTRGGRLTARGSGSNAVTLAGSDVRPGSTGTGASGSSLPIALIVVLILLALTAVSGGAVAIRRRVVARGT